MIVWKRALFVFFFYCYYYWLKIKNKNRIPFFITICICFWTLHLSEKGNYNKRFQGYIELILQMCNIFILGYN